MGAAFFRLLQAFLIRERDDQTLIGDLVGAAGLTMVGAVAHALLIIVIPALLLARLVPWPALLAFAPSSGEPRAASIGKRRGSTCGAWDGPRRRWHRPS